MNLKIPPVLTSVIAGLIMWPLSIYLPETYIDFDAPNWIPILIIYIGCGIGVTGVVQFFINKTTVNPHKPENSSILVKNGIYRISRNPMYLWLLMMLIAQAVYLGSGYAFLVIPIFIWYMNSFQIKPEEQALQEKFGSEYSAYKEKVRRWI